MPESKEMLLNKTKQKRNKHPVSGYANGMEEPTERAPKAKSRKIWATK